MEGECFLCCCSNCEQFHSLGTYRTSVFPLSLYRTKSSIGQLALYKTLLLLLMLRKTVRQEQIQGTKSTRNQTSMLNEIWTSVFMNQNSVFLFCLPISNWKFHRAVLFWKSVFSSQTTRANPVFKSSIIELKVQSAASPNRTEQVCLSCGRTTGRSNSKSDQIGPVSHRIKRACCVHQPN